MEGMTWYDCVAMPKAISALTSLVLALVAVALAGVSAALASSPPAVHGANYYVTDGRAKLAGPFPSYHLCAAALDARKKQPNALLFCASGWVRR